MTKDAQGWRHLALEALAVLLPPCCPRARGGCEVLAHLEPFLGSQGCWGVERTCSPNGSPLHRLPPTLQLLAIKPFAETAALSAASSVNPSLAVLENTVPPTHHLKYGFITLGCVLISSLLQSLTLSDCPVGYVWYVLIRVPVMWCSLHFLKPGVLLGPYEELRVSPILLRTPQLRCLAPKGSCCNNNEGKPLLFSFREVCKGAIMLCSSAGQGTQERRNLFL